MRKSGGDSGAWTQHATLFVPGSSYEPEGGAAPTWLTAEQLWAAIPG